MELSESLSKQLRRNDSVETDFILHDPIKGWNATFRLRQGYDGQAGRVFPRENLPTRPEVAFHLLQLHDPD